MFGNLMKSLPAEFVYIGYPLKKSLGIMTNNVDGKIVYDIFEFTYISNHVSMFLLMEDGTYKYPDGNNAVVSNMTAVDLASRHLFRGYKYSPDDYETFDKDQVIGFFGGLKIHDFMVASDQRDKDNNNHQMSLEALYDLKKSFTGAEITAMINRFNSSIAKKEEYIQVPAIKYDLTDTYDSLIGDEMEFFDFVSNKSSEDIIKDFIELNKESDGLGNKK